MCFTIDSKKLITGSADNKIIVWDVGLNKIEKILTGHTNQINGLAVSSD